MNSSHEPTLESPMSARSLIRPGLLLATAGLALTVAACGTSTPTAAPPTSKPAAPAVRAQAQTPPGAFGTAAAVSATSIEVQSRQEGQVTVKFTGSTTFTDTVKASLADVRPGQCVVVTSRSGGKQPTKLTARTVAISRATTTGCAAGFGDRAGDPSRRPRPTGTPATFGRAFGKVTAVSANGFTVQDVAGGSTTAVTVNASTTYTKTATATASALAVGDCIAALGPADDTGAVTAKTIAVSEPDGTTGCDGGFAGRGRGGFRGNGNGGGEGGPAPSQVPGSGNG
jgi:hypothetical protein